MPSRVRARTCPDCGIVVYGSSGTMTCHRRRAHRPWLEMNRRAQVTAEAKWKTVGQAAR
jgi:hypothetical protein